MPVSGTSPRLGAVGLAICDGILDSKSQAGSWGNVYLIYLRLSYDYIPGGTLPNPGGLERPGSQQSLKARLSRGEFEWPQTPATLARNDVC